MIIEIEEELFNKLKDLMKNRSKSIYEELSQIKPLETVATDNTLEKAREVKTQRVKQSIKETIKSILNANMKLSKYQIHKRTGIAYITINKYYDEIFDEVLNEDN
ncbi:hypothetical protein CPG38_06850 [Malaciobacter marinus]|uniref:hypothetical protein n=1 Tax=Malaciobacter marinus TaxID=505249 RepID=UPI000C08A1B9|nr:hypothetical protein [Malaciobacter marinus]PHO12560.1 hypothetical protein CPG38_06850 [Malaciobacter marinus]